MTPETAASGQPMAAALARATLTPTEIGHSAAKECPISSPPPPPPTVGLDLLDEFSLIGIPDALQNDVLPALTRTVTALSHEGGRGATTRRLLARDIALARVRLRHSERLQSEALGSAQFDPQAMRNALQLTRIVEAEHRRLLASIELLIRLDAPPVAAVSVTAKQAMVVAR